MIPQDNYKALGYGQLAVTAAALLSTITGGIPAGTRLAIITPDTQAARWRDDGTAPTTTVGYPLPVGSELRYDGQQFSSLQFIAQTGTSTLNVTFYG